MQPLAHSVEFFGRPVESVRVSVDMGDDHDSSARSSSSATPTVVVKRDQVSMFLPLDDCAKPTLHKQPSVRVCSSDALLTLFYSGL